MFETIFSAERVGAEVFGKVAMSFRDNSINGGVIAMWNSTSNRHTPRMRGIQYAAASRFYR